MNNHRVQPESRPGPRPDLSQKLETLPDRPLYYVWGGEPSMWMSVEDALRRGVNDNDFVRVRNEQGEFRVRARVAASVALGEAILYHAWEPYQFPGWRGNMEVVASPYKPIHLVGDYGHLRYRVFESGPMHVPRGVPVEIEKI